MSWRSSGGGGGGGSSKTPFTTSLKGARHNNSSFSKNHDESKKVNQLTSSSVYSTVDRSLRRDRVNCLKCNGIGHIAKNCRFEVKGWRQSGGGNANWREEGNSPTFGIRKLIKLLREDENVGVIMFIGRKLEEWKKFLQDSNDEGNEDLLLLVLHLLAHKICMNETILESLQDEVVVSSLSSQFINFIKSKVEKITFSGDTHSAQQLNPGMMEVDKSRVGIVVSIYKVLSFTSKRLPVFTLDYLKDLVPLLVGVCNIMTLSSPHDSQLVELNCKVNELFIKIGELNKKEETKTESKKKNWRSGISEEVERILHESSPPENFRSLSIFPTVSELLSTEEVYLRTNKKSGAYSHSEHYLDVQFRLLREDFMSPLREGVQDYLKYKLEYLSKTKKFPVGNVRLYPNVRILSSLLLRGKLLYNIQLPYSIYSRIDWEKSKRLINGSLLILSSNDFKTAYFATVERGGEWVSLKGVIGVFFEREPPAKNSQNFVMIESEVYFEAYRHTLQSLKTIDLSSFPLSKFIVSGSERVGVAKYYTDKSSSSKMKIGGKIFSPLNNETWPSSEYLGLDSNQYEAFKAALINEFSIIQGPPGTGKTFIGLKLAESLLHNNNLWFSGSGGGILVVCYTNHALDQFLDGILGILSKRSHLGGPSLVRVGSRTKSEKLEEFSLHKARLRWNEGRRGLKTEFCETRREAYKFVESSESQRSAVISQAFEIKNAEGIIDFKELTGLHRIGEIPLEFQSIAQSENYFGLNSPFLKYQNMNAHLVIVSWFGPLLPMSPPHNFTNIKTPHDFNFHESHEFSNENKNEDFINPEGNYEHNYTHFEYIPGCSLYKIKSNLSTNLLKLETMARDLKNDAIIPHLTEFEIKNKMSLIENEVINLKNRYNILSLILKYQKEGRLRLPDVAQILKKMSSGTQVINKLICTKYNMSIDKMSISERYALYFHYINVVASASKNMIESYTQNVIYAHKRLENINNMADVYLLRRVQVIGMTTTGAAKNRHLLEMIRPKIVIVEEAAEVLESHIVTCLTQSCEQLILIGDHQQLRPSTAVYKLAKNYNLDISLFERMINNNLNVYKLKAQHRMRSEIADLVRGTIYNELDDDPIVHEYPNIRGMSSNLFFISHNERESNESESKTKSNDFEAEFLTSLCRHLLLQGYNPEKITVLTTYVGQMFLIKNKMSQVPICKDVRVTVVDNYQGEENDIILLSLVRSNDENNIGFLKTDSRICVALSRAKHGLYICGNMDTLSSNSLTWVQIRDKLEKRNEIGTQLEIICENHKVSNIISNGAEFRTKSPVGGCTKICNQLLECSHYCDKMCHVLDNHHYEYRCEERCVKVCDNKHPCPAFCYENCPPCEIMMFKNLQCGHSLALSCSTQPSRENCMELVTKTLPCGHDKNMSCKLDPASVNCEEKVTKTLNCGHEKELLCHEEPNSINCEETVLKILTGCGHEKETQCFYQPDFSICLMEVEKIIPGCGHMIKARCKDVYNKDLTCKVVCSTTLSCGHVCTDTCHATKDPNHINYKCIQKCTKKCEQDMHECGKKHDCKMPCPPCDVKIVKILGCKAHFKKDIPCHHDPSSIQCDSICEKINERCGHKCSKKCSQNCEPCETIVLKTGSCGHGQDTKCGEEPSASKCQKLVETKILPTCSHVSPLTKVPCMIKDSVTADEITELWCNQKCGYVFENFEQSGCSHACQGTCSKCFQGRLHLKCMEKCGRSLICGHICDVSCSMPCPPCKKKCTNRCEHFECKNLCGEPCSPCKENCSWVCEHKICTKKCGEACNREPCDEPCQKTLKCEHQCIGFCGEKCPTQCRICDKDELTEKIFGHEDKEDARFIYLPDCKHAIEAHGLTYYMNENIEEGEILSKTCPKCKTVIRNCRRFSTILKMRQVDIMKIKKKVYEMSQDAHMTSSSLIEKVVDNLEWKKYFSYLHDYVTDKLISRSTGKKTKNQQNSNPTPLFAPKKVSKTEAESLSLIVHYGEHVMTMLKRAEKELNLKARNILKTKYLALFNKLMLRSLPLSLTEILNFNLEFERVYDFYQLLLRRNDSFYANKTHIGTILYDEGVRVLEEKKLYSIELKSRFKALLRRIDDETESGLQVVEMEKFDILRESNSYFGRWFKCPNEHYYIKSKFNEDIDVQKCTECE